MNYAEIISKLDETILDGISDKTPLDLNDSTDLIDDLLFDSISIITLVVNIEIAFNIEIPDNILSVENLRNYYILKNIVIDIISKKESSEEEE